MSSNHDQCFSASLRHSDLTDNEPYLTTSYEDSALFVLPDGASNYLPGQVLEDQYRRNGLHLQGIQQSRPDLFDGRICLTGSSPESDDLSQFNWSFQQTNFHDHKSEITPIHITLGRQIHLECSTSAALGRKAATCVSRTPAQRTRRTKDSRQAHSIVERRYRDRVNNKLKELYDTLRQAKNHLGSQLGASGCPITSEPSTGMKKFEVINDAITYIHESEINFRHMADEIQSLRDQLGHPEDKRIVRTPIYM